MPHAEFWVYDTVVQSSVWAPVSLGELVNALAVVASRLWTRKHLQSYPLEDECSVRKISQDDTYPVDTTI